MPSRTYADGTVLGLDYDSPRITSEWFECGLPMTFDQYNRCAFNCTYCFAAFLAAKQSKCGTAGDRDKARSKVKYRQPTRAVNPEKIKHLWGCAKRGEVRKTGTTSMLLSLIRAGAPVHWGGLCDPFDPFERRFKIGVELLEFWRSVKQPIVFSTKGHELMCEEPWASVLRKGNIRFQFSIPMLDGVKCKQIDSGVGTPEERLQACAYVTQSLGLQASIRIRPIIPGVVSVEESCTLVRRAHEAGASGVSVSFFSMDARDLDITEKYKRMSALAGFDLVAFYKRNSPGQSGMLRANRALKGTYFLPMAKEAARLGMRFSVSDRHFKELGSVGACCNVYDNSEMQGCGSQTLDGFDPVFISKSTLGYAMMFARVYGRVRWSDVSETSHWADHKLSADLGAVMERLPSRFAHREQTLADVMRTQWNTPNNDKSPYKFSAGKVAPVGVDEHNDVIYEYRREAWDDEAGLPPPTCAFDVPVNTLVRP